MRILIKIYITGLLLCMTQSTIGQTMALTLKNESTFSDRLSGIRISYFGDNGVHPGIRLGGSIILSEKEKAKKYLSSKRKEKKGSKLKIIQHLVDVNVGGYNHPNNHFGIMAGAGLTRMVTRTTKGITSGLSLEGNYLKRTYNIPTYEIDNNGDFLEVNGAGNHTLMLSFAPSIGKLIELKSDRSLHIYFKQHFQIFNYSYAIFPNAATEIGVRISL